MGGSAHSIIDCVGVVETLDVDNNVNTNMAVLFPCDAVFLFNVSKNGDPDADFFPGGWIQCRTPPSERLLRSGGAAQQRRKTIKKTIPVPVGRVRKRGVFTIPSRYMEPASGSRRNV